jgi:hypothetical protein
VEVFPAYRCAVLGSAKDKNFAADKEVGFHPSKIIITTGSCFNNAYEFLQDWAQIC